MTTEPFPSMSRIAETPGQPGVNEQADEAQKTKAQQAAQTGVMHDLQWPGIHCDTSRWIPGDIRVIAPEGGGYTQDEAEQLVCSVFQDASTNPYAQEVVNKVNKAGRIFVQTVDPDVGSHTSEINFLTPAVWDPTMGFACATGGYQSAATALIHELYHMYVNKDPNHTGGIVQKENAWANKWGECSQRYYMDGNNIRMDIRQGGPRSTTPLRP